VGGSTTAGVGLSRWSASRWTWSHAGIFFAITKLVSGRELRRHAAAFVGLALIVALGGGVAIGALVAAHRTDRAYPDYVRDSQVVELSVNPSNPTKAIDEVMHHLPGVASVHSDSLLFASANPKRSGRLSDMGSEDASLQVRGSIDGRFEQVDRPIVTQGRFASGPREVFIGDGYRPDLEKMLGRTVNVGDTIKLAFYWAFLSSDELPPDTVVKPIAVERLRVAGFGRFPDEVLPDELYPRQKMVVSADVARRYHCDAHDPRPDMTQDELSEALYPKTCPRLYDTYALQLEDGRRSEAAVRRAFTKATARLSKAFPAAMQAQNITYSYLSQDRTDIDDSVRDVTWPTVIALQVFGVVSGLAVLAVVALAIARLLRRGDEARRSLRAMGATSGQLTAIGACPALLACLVGVIGAVLVAFGASMVGPTGAIRSITPSPGFALPAGVVIPAAAIAVALLAGVTVVLSWFATRRTRLSGAVRHERPGLTTLLVRTGRPAATQGIRHALRLRRSDGAAVTLAGCVIALALVTAVVVFGVNLGRVQQPSRFGWPWDVAVITNAGYGDANPARVAKSLDHNPDVAGRSLFAFAPSSSIDGHPVPTIYGFPGSDSTHFPLLEGREAREPGEAVLGARTADDLGVSVGDRISHGGSNFPLRSIRIVGIAALPSLGPLFSDRTGLGVGAYVRVKTDPGDPTKRYPAAMVGINLRPGVDNARFLAHLDPPVATWADTSYPATTFTAPVRPPAIVNADDVRTAPLILGGLLALGLAIGFALSIGVSVRDRRRELAILRSLGFSRRNLRATVEWQAIAIIAVGVLIGLPVGVAVGRFAWTTFADQLGVAPDAGVPWAWLAVIGVGAAVIGLAAAAPSARAAARVAPNELLERG
jgi:FtsX-like permease family/MacB-like periplasmic core domain